MDTFTSVNSIDTSVCIANLTALLVTNVIEKPKKTGEYDAILGLGMPSRLYSDDGTFTLTEESIA